MLATAGLNGAPQALLSAHGFDASLIAGLVDRGLATLTAEKVRVGDRARCSQSSRRCINSNRCANVRTRRRRWRSRGLWRRGVRSWRVRGRRLFSWLHRWSSQLAAPGVGGPHSFAGRSFVGRGFRPGFHGHRFARFGVLFGLGLGLGYGAYSYYGDSCYAWTPYGYRWVCGYDY
jgi:hypothetical protein